MAKIEVGELITIDMTDEERDSYLRAYASEHFRPESNQVIQDVMDSNDGDINTAFSQGAINEMIIEAMELAISFEQTAEGIINGSNE